mgnify:CR=1 FL=1
MRKIVTHKFRKTDNEVVYLVNLVDWNFRPLESHVANNPKEKVEVAEDLAIQHDVQLIHHNSGYSVIE